MTVLQMAAALRRDRQRRRGSCPRGSCWARGIRTGSFLQRDRPGRGACCPARRRAGSTAMLEGVIESGTGSRASVPGYRIAGKSGTAQMAVAGGYSDTDYMASFGGFGPVGAPRLVALVVIDSPRGRGVTAARSRHRSSAGS